MNKPRLYIGIIFVSLLAALGIQAWRDISSYFSHKTAGNEEELYYPFDRRPQQSSEVSLNNNKIFLGDYESEIALQPDWETEAAPKPVLAPAAEQILNDKTAEIAAENDKIEEAVLKKYYNLPIMQQFNAQLKAAAGGDEEKILYFFLSSDKQTLNPEIKEVLENFSKNPQFTDVMKQMLADKDFLFLLKKYAAPQMQTNNTAGK